MLADLFLKYMGKLSTKPKLSGKWITFRKGPLMIDLHVHSNRSDGTYSPKELVDYAIQKGLTAFALTDHDTVDGLQEALSYAASLRMNHEDSDSENSIMSTGTEHTVVPEIVPGIELSTEYQGRDVHILGLYIDYENKEFKKYLQDFVDSRTARNQKMCALLQGAGIDISYEALLAAFPDAVITRAHYAKYMLTHGYIKSMKEAFDRYIGDNCPYYIPREKVTPAQAVELILNAGGIPVLAHPTLYRLGHKALDSLVAELKAVGLMGIEAVYSTYTTGEERQIRTLAAKYNLLISGGSDFHGNNKPGLDLGIGYGKLYVDDSVLCNIREIHAKTDKILFSDMDGTLLLSNSTVSPGMKEGIRRMTAAGHHLILTSGRPLLSILEVCDLFDLHFPNMYIISNNGAIVYCCDQKKNISEYRIAQPDIAKIVKMATDAGIHIHGYTDTEIVCRQDNAELQFYTKRIHIPLKYVDDIADALPQGSYKLQTIHLTDKHKLEQFRDLLLADKDLSSRIQAFFSNDQYLEILPIQANKGTAVRFVTDYLKVHPCNTFAAGDAENDIPMLDAAYHGIAMQNAIPAVKAHADIVTERTNDEDGLLEIIEKYFLR